MLPINFNLIILFYNWFFLNEMQHNFIHFFNLSLLSSTLRKRSFFYQFPIICLLSYRKWSDCGGKELITVIAGKLDSCFSGWKPVKVFTLALDSCGIFHLFLTVFKQSNFSWLFFQFFVELIKLKWLDRVKECPGVRRRWCGWNISSTFSTSSHL